MLSKREKIIGTTQPPRCFRHTKPLAIIGMLCLALLGTCMAWGMGSRVPIQGTQAENFQLTDLKGQTHQLNQYQGKVVLLNFWATWCKPCVTEMPAMQASYDRLKDQGFVVLAVNELEDLEMVRAHIQEHQHTFPVLLDVDNEVANLYGVFGLPVSVFIDPSGVIREYFKGGLLTEEKINLTFQKLQESTERKS